MTETHSTTVLPTTICAPAGWYGFRDGRALCGVGTSEDTYCDRKVGHGSADQDGDDDAPVRHRAHDPSASGAFIEFDDDGTILRHSPIGGPDTHERPSTTYADFAAEQYHEAVATVSQRLRDLADEVDRVGKVQTTVGSIPAHSAAAQRVVRSVTWGLANASIGRVVGCAAEADAGAARRG